MFCVLLAVLIAYSDILTLICVMFSISNIEGLYLLLSPVIFGLSCLRVFNS